MDSKDSSIKINPDAELEAIKEVLASYEKGSLALQDKLKSKIEKQQKALDEKAKRRKEEINTEIAELAAKGLIKANEDAANFAKVKLQEQQKEKLESEINILKQISQEGAKERAKQEEYLKAEKEILELRNSGSEKEARQKEKELAKQKKKDDREKEKEDAKKEHDSYSFGDLFKENFKELGDQLNDPAYAAKKTAEEDLIKTMKGIGRAIEDGLNAINNAISSYAKYQTSINTRLQGISSYSKAVKTLSDVAFSPLIKAEDLYTNLSDLVNQGIATNVEQRAMFATVKDGIAGTFDVTSDSLKRLIRVQQNDSTAARLGMEAYLTKFLNVYVENTEYLQSTFDSVSSSLLEASSMMYLSNKQNGAAASAELEYVVQKWLGTLSGVGLSDTAAQSIAGAIGQLGSGDVDSLGSSDIQNLIVMAASKVGLSYSEMLNKGLDANQANDLMLGMVEYLQEVAETGTNVVKSQLANVFGVTVSDLVAVSNLSNESLKTVHNDLLSYKNMYGELEEQFKDLPGRLGISNILENLFANFTYQTGMNIASNPATYALWKITDLIQGVTGGIQLPFINAMGFGVDLNTSVENLMKLGVVGASTFSGIGKIINGLASIGDGSILLRRLKVSEAGAEVKTFGGAELKGKKRKSGQTTSETSYVGNSDSDSYYDSTVNAANDDSEKKLDAKREEYKDPVVEYLKEDLKYDEVLKKITEDLSYLVGFRKSSAEASEEKEDTNNSTSSNLPDANSSAIVAEITALNETVLSGVETLNKTIMGIFKEYTNTANSAYNDYSEKLSQDLNTSYSEISGDVLNQIQISQNATPNDSTDKTSTQTITQYDKYLSEQGIINNNSTNISNSTADIGDYLSEIDFSNGFKLLVDNVSKIKNLLENDNLSSSISDNGIIGFTQHTFNE